MPRGTPGCVLDGSAGRSSRVAERGRLTRVRLARCGWRGIRRPVAQRGRSTTARVGLLPDLAEACGGLGGHRMAMADPRRIKPKRRAPRLREGCTAALDDALRPFSRDSDTLAEGTRPSWSRVPHRRQCPMAAPRRPRWLPGLPIRRHAGVWMRSSCLQARPARLGLPRGAAGGTVAAGPAGAPPAPVTVWPSRVYLSRTAFNSRMRALGRHEPRSSPERDALLDELFAECRLRGRCSRAAVDR